MRQAASEASAASRLRVLVPPKHTDPLSEPMSPLAQFLAVDCLGWRQTRMNLRLRPAAHFMRVPTMSGDEWLESHVSDREGRCHFANDGVIVQ